MTLTPRHVYLHTETAQLLMRHLDARRREENTSPEVDQRYILQRGEIMLTSIWVNDLSIEKRCRLVKPGGDVLAILSL
jgi:hypothetical protein